MTVYYNSKIFSIVLRSESTFSDAMSASSIHHNQYDNIFRKEIICFYKVLRRINSRNQLNHPNFTTNGHYHIKKAVRGQKNAPIEMDISP